MENSPGPTVELTVNGEAHAAAAGSNLLDLLQSFGQDPRTVAIEHNGEIVPRARYGEVGLQAGDVVEIVRFVQGG